MISLLHLNFKHILRSRLLLLFLVFSSLLHISGLKIIHKLTVQIQGVIQVVGPREGVFLSLYFQLFAGIFLAAVYGIWMMPYLHSGGRTQLSFVLPISKWKYAMSYALSFFALICVEQVIMLGSFGMVFGWQALVSPDFPWSGFLSCALLELLAFEATVFGFAFLSLVFGQVQTFFLSMIAFLMLQTTASLLRIGLDRFFETSEGIWKWIPTVYGVLPPIGELIFDLKLGFMKSFTDHKHFILWAVWLVIFVVLFRVRLQFPSLTRGRTE